MKITTTIEMNHRDTRNGSVTITVADSPFKHVGKDLWFHTVLFPLVYEDGTADTVDDIETLAVAIKEASWLMIAALLNAMREERQACEEWTKELEMRAGYIGDGPPGFVAKPNPDPYGEEAMKKVFGGTP